MLAESGIAAKGIGVGLEWASVIDIYSRRFECGQHTAPPPIQFWRSTPSFHTPLSRGLAALEWLCLPNQRELFD